MINEISKARINYETQRNDAHKELKGLRLQRQDLIKSMARGESTYTDLASLCDSIARLEKFAAAMSEVLLACNAEGELAKSKINFKVAVKATLDKYILMKASKSRTPEHYHSLREQAKLANMLEDCDTFIGGLANV